MSEYKPTEYVVDFGDGRSNSFVRLNMALLRENGSKLVERVVRCRDCRWFNEDRRDTSIGWVDVFVCDSEQWSTSSMMPSHKVQPDGYCAWGERKEGSK